MIVAFAAGVMLAARGATLCEGESAAGTVDLTPGVRTASGSEAIRYSSVWTTSVLSGPKAVVKVCPVKSEKPKYIAIDLSGGPSATHYPIECLDDVPDGGWSDEYKTSKLVLRHIPAGSFVMGERATDYPEGAIERVNGTIFSFSASVNTNLHLVVVDKDFYIGVFEVTQRQWELVMGNRPSAFTNATCYTTRPVEQVRYEDIRGDINDEMWPNMKDVDGDSFLGMLRRKSGLDRFDLPSETQWEYACRAGTSTGLNSGKDITFWGNGNEMCEVGRNQFNSGWQEGASWSTVFANAALDKGTAAVGSYLPNDFGIYDMHGNVWELCLDRPDWTSNGHLTRGGGWSTTYRITSGIRSSLSQYSNAAGFRLCLHGGEIPEMDESTVLVNAAGEGATNWTPPMKAGRYYLTHETQTNGVNGAELLGALFDVEGPELTFAADGELVPGVKVSIGGVDDGWTIRYEVGGAMGSSRPTGESPIYEGPITLNESSTIRAVAFFGDGMESKEFSATFSLMDVVGAVARPRYPWNGKVDIDVTVKGDANEKYLVTLSAVDVDGGTNLPVRTVVGRDDLIAPQSPAHEFVLSSDSAGVSHVALSPGNYRFTWDADADIVNDIDIANVAVSVSVEGGTTAGATKVLPLEVAGYAGEETLADVPVLVRLSSAISGFSYEDFADANDIVFTDESGIVVYPHEIDEWNTNGESLVWVKLPQMANGTKFKMANGNSKLITPNSKLSPHDVWRDYAGVWHMNEDSGTAYDSTAHGLDAMPSCGTNALADIGQMVAYENGACGRARVNATENRTSGNYMLVPSYDALALGGEFVFSGWVKKNGYSASPRFVSRKERLWDDASGWEICVGTLTMRAASADYLRLESFDAREWTMIHGIYSGYDVALYTNGMLAATATLNAMATDNGMTLAFGGFQGNDSSHSLNGQYDEIRLRGGTLSADRIKADYDMINDRNFLTYGSVVRVQDTVWRPDAAVITSTTDAFRLSVKHDGIRTSAGHETLAYSLLWNDAVEGATVTIEQDGEVLAEGLTGEGVLPWNVAHNGTYVLTYKVMSGDEQVGEALTATFFVEPENPVISPASGTTFGSSLTVTMSCPTEGAKIHYTTDGSDPTAESPLYSRFRVNSKTTVKAVAEKNGMLSEVVVAEYAPGRCVDPVFSLADGAEFAHSNQVVTIRWKNDGVLRYTLDGTDPTEESPVYEGPFSLSDSTELRAKVFSDEFFESNITTARLTRVWENVATPVIDAAESFSGSKAKVVITSATDGAIIHYTLDGSEPDANSPVYTGPIYVTASCTIKAYAEAVDYLDSVVVTKSIEKVWVIGDALGKPDHAFTTGEGGTSAWTRVTDATAPNGEAMRSGVITHYECSVLSTKVMGPGTLTFSWRTSCEKDPGGFCEWDHVELAVDDTVVRKLDGITAWTNETVRIEGDGEHAVEWRYVKDDFESAGEDAAWVAGYGWATDYTETQTTEVPVPYAWLLQHDPEIVDEFDVYEAAAKAANGKKDFSGNVLQVWQDYVAGTDPTNLASRFTANIEMVDGVPIVTWEPDLNTNGIIRTYKVYGKETLEDGCEWQYPTNSLHRFFKVSVEMP